MARAQNSYMAGSTSPSSLIQTACFFWGCGAMEVFDGVVVSMVVMAEVFVAVSFAAESTVAFSTANVNVAKNAKKRNNFDKIFILSMYKVLFSNERFL